MDGHAPRSSQVRGTAGEVRLAAQRLRARMTPAECLLWSALRRRQLDGLRFRRQHPVGPFILDFYCPAHRLVVEVDGGVHDESGDRDALRTEVLARHRYQVLRFRNEEVMRNLPAVLSSIATAARTAHNRRPTSGQPKSPDLS